MSSQVNHYPDPLNTETHGLIHKIALVAVLCFIFLIPWGDGLWDGLARVFGVLSFGAAIWLLIMEGTHRNYTLFHLLAIMFWIWVIFSVIWTPDLDQGKFMAGRIFQIMLLPLLFTLILDSKQSIKLAYQSYVVGNIVASGIIVYNYLNGIQSPYYNRYTVQNIETDSMSILLALAIPMAAYLASKLEKKWMRTINLLAIPLIVFAIFLTGTRTGSVIAVIGLLYWLFTHRKASFRIKISILFVFIFSIILVFSFAPKASIDRVFSTKKSLQSGNLNSRTLIWKASLDQWKKSPIIGTGLGGLGYVLSQKNLTYKEAHNTFIHLLTENGVVGLILYLLLIMSIFHYISKAPFEERVFLYSLLMVLLVSQLTLHRQIGKETWFIYTMIVMHAIYSSKNKSIPSE